MVAVSMGVSVVAVSLNRANDTAASSFLHSLVNEMISSVPALLLPLSDWKKSL